MLDVLALPWRQLFNQAFRTEYPPRDRVQDFRFLLRLLSSTCLICALNELDGDVHFEKYRRKFVVNNLRLGLIQVSSDRQSLWVDQKEASHPSLIIHPLLL